MNGNAEVGMHSQLGYGNIIVGYFVGTGGGSGTDIHVSGKTWDVERAKTGYVVIGNNLLRLNFRKVSSGFDCTPSIA